jgi:hypothetical protein
MQKEILSEHNLQIYKSAKVPIGQELTHSNLSVK